MGIDVRQHDLTIANRNDSVAVILLNMDISLVELAGMVEFEFVHSRREVRNRRTDPAFANDKRIGTVTTSHGHVAARRHQCVIQIPAGQGIFARGSDHKLRHTVGSLFSGRVYSSQGAAVPLGGDESVTLHRCGISVAQDQVRQGGALDLI